MTSTSETFEQLVDEFRRLSHEDLENEVVGEGYPLDMYLYPGTSQPYDASGPSLQEPLGAHRTRDQGLCRQHRRRQPPLHGR